MFTSCKMANRIFLLCLLVSVLTVSHIEGRGRSGGRGWGGRSSRGWGRSSSSSYGKSWRSSKPSSSSSSHWGSTSSHRYPPSSSGLSGSSKSHSYPSSSSGLSGSSNNNNYKPTHTYNTHYHHNTVPSAVPTYYTAPHYVYTHEYRNSNSRYGDLLTGLSLYNLGRSHSHYHNQYYYDDYYKRRYDNPSSSSYRQENKPQDANCILKVKENGRVEVLKIPCEIVSTFTQGSKKVAPSQQTQVSKTVCTTTFTTINNTVSSTTAAPVVPVLPAVAVNDSSINSTVTKTNKNGQVNGFGSDILWTSLFGNDSSLNAMKAILDSASPVKGASESDMNLTGQENGFDPKMWASLFSEDSSLNNKKVVFDSAVPVNGASETDMNFTGQENEFDPKMLTSLFGNDSSLNALIDVLDRASKNHRNRMKRSLTVPINVSSDNPTVTTTTFPVNGSSATVTKIVTTVNATTVNVTVCTTNSTLVDPLTVQGPPVNAKDMECVVEIQTRDDFLSNVIDCSTLTSYAKMPEPKKDIGILPERAKLKSWLANPPWWMSLFIAV